MSTPYTNDPARTLDRIAQEADAQAAFAASYSNLLTRAKATVASAETDFFNSLSPESATALADAQRRVVDLTVVVSAIERCGGIEEVRERHLRTPGVFSVFSEAFAEKAGVIEKLVAPALKRLAQRRGQLTEAGLPFQYIELDPFVTALRDHHAAIAPALAVAIFGKNYADKRGEGYEKKSFDELYADLTQPLPLPPSEPAV